MADGSVVIEIKGDASDVEEKIEDLGNSIAKGVEPGAEQASTALEHTNTAASKLAKVGLAAVTGAATAMASALAAGATAAVMAGSQYETAFAQVETIMDKNVVSATEMSSAIVDLSNQTGQSAAELSESVYNAISATGDTANAVSLVADATKLATAGFAESSDALSVLTTITNAYGMSTTEAAAISDSLIQTQNLGVTTVAQLSTSMGKAIATAAAYSIDLYNLEAAYVSLTKAGISTEESTTYVSAMFKELGDSGSDVAKIINEQTGQSFGQLMQSGASLGDVLQILIEYVDGDTEALMNLWGSAEAGKAASAIASQGISEFNSNLNSLQNSAGATESAYETMTQTLSYQTDLLKTRITNLGTAIYEKFGDSIIEGVSSLSEAFSELQKSVTDGELADSVDELAGALSDLVSDGAQKLAAVLPSLISGLSWFASNLGPIAIAVGGLAAAYGVYEGAVIASTIAQEGLNAVLALNPYGLALAGITLAVAGIAAYVDSQTQLTEEARSLQESNREVSTTTNEIVTALANLRNGYDATRDTIQGAYETNDQLIDSLIRMVGAYDGSASSAARINAIIDQLNAAIPGLNVAFDEQSGSINRTSEEMKMLNDQYAKEQEWQAAETALTEATNQHTAAVENAAKAKEAEAKAAQALQDALDEGGFDSYYDAMERGTLAQKSNIRNLQIAYNDLHQSAIDAATAEQDSARACEATGRAAHSAEEAYYATVDAVAALSDAEEEAAGSGSKLSDEQKAVVASLTQIWSSAKKASGSATELRAKYNELQKQYDALETEGLDYSASLAEQALAELDLAATTAELSEALGTLGSLSGLNLGEVASQLIATGQSASSFASEFNSALSGVVNGYKNYQQESYISLQSSTEALQANVTAHANWQNNITTLWNQAVDSGDAAQMAYVQSLYEMGDASSQIVEELQGNGQALADNAALYAEATQQAGQEAALGLAMEAGQVYDASVQVADSVNQGLEEGASEAQTAGSQYDTDMATGMTDNVGVVETAATTVVNAAKSAAGAVDFTSVGYYISAGIAAGIASGESMVTTAAVNVVKAAKAAADAEAQIGSPSKLFRDEVGYWISAGMAKGIEKGSPLVETQSESVIEKAKQATMPIVETVRDGVSSGNITNIYNNGTLSGLADRVRNVVVPLYLNGREFARATAEDMWNQLDYMS